MVKNGEIENPMGNKQNKEEDKTFKKEETKEVERFQQNLSEPIRNLNLSLKDLTKNQKTWVQIQNTSYLLKDLKFTKPPIEMVFSSNIKEYIEVLISKEVEDILYFMKQDFVSIFELECENLNDYYRTLRPKTWHKRGMIPKTHDESHEKQSETLKTLLNEYKKNEEITCELYNLLMEYKINLPSNAFGAYKRRITRRSNMIDYGYYFGELESFYIQ